MIDNQSHFCQCGDYLHNLIFQKGVNLEPFIKKYSDFIELCRVKGFPVHELEYIPKINPFLDPTPREWLLESFDWFVAIQLTPGGSYGPFYRVGGDMFWPEIGNIYGLYSEKNCFFGLTKPTNKRHVRELYDPKPSTPLEYVFEFRIELPPSLIEDRAYVFVGPVKNAKGVQLNPNSLVATIIRSMILCSKVTKYGNVNDEYDYEHGIPYL